ncbi:MAG TPA: pyridoxal 5'-phosphate synthase glutaminase subunit PdxT [Thermoanaerobaculia bacterium]
MAATGAGGPENDGRPVAVLALQGDFEAHRRALSEIGVESFEAKRPGDLSEAGGLIIPGGESTTLWKFFEAEPWEEAFRAFARTGRPVLGTCAGAIVLAREVSNPPQKGLGLVDVAVERNAYGRQVDSFIAEVACPALGAPLPAVFIRAPRIRAVGGGAEVLGSYAGQPVLVRQGNVAVATFHPELTNDRRLHGLLFGASGRARRTA